MNDLCPENDAAWGAEQAAIHGQDKKIMTMDYHIEVLETANARLREALEDIAGPEVSFLSDEGNFDRCRNIAIDALNIDEAKNFK